MNKALKIFLLICLFVLFIFSVCVLIFSIQMIKDSTEMYQFALSMNFANNIKRFKNYTILSYVTIIFSLVIMCFSVFLPLMLWRFPKYTYNEYKAIMDKKKIENQEKKRLKLQQQLNVLDKTE